MALFLITGLPGSGKSTVWQALKARGYDAYDGDKDHIAKWYDNVTGIPVADKDEERSIEFIRSHWRGIKREDIKALAQKANDRTIFLCNDPQNEDELRDLFDGIVALVIDEDTIKYRLRTRKGETEWGKRPHELEYVLRSQQRAYDMYKMYNYATVDASQPVDKVVDDILQLVEARE